MVTNPMSAMALKLTALLLTCVCCFSTSMLNPGFWNQVPEGPSPLPLAGAQDQQPGTEQNQHPCGPTGISSGNCQETETCTVWAWHMPQQPLQNHPSGHPERWVIFCGWQRQYWMANVKEWTSLPVPEPFTTAFWRKNWKRISAELSVMSSWWPNWSKDWM